MANLHVPDRVANDLYGLADTIFLCVSAQSAVNPSFLLNNYRHSGAGTSVLIPY